MRRLIYRRSAQRDFVSIFEFVARESGSIETARRLTNRLPAQCRRLADLPGRLGRPRPELVEGIRSFPLGNYVIFFRYCDETILEIVAVVERHRDVESGRDP